MKTKNSTGNARATKDLRPRNLSAVKGGVSDDATQDLRGMVTKVEKNTAQQAALRKA